MIACASVIMFLVLIIVVLVFFIFAEVIISFCGVSRALPGADDHPPPPRGVHEYANELTH